MQPVERAGAMGGTDVGHDQHAGRRVGGHHRWPDAEVRGGLCGAKGARDIDVAGGVRVHRLDMIRLASDGGAPVQAVDAVPSGRSEDGESRLHADAVRRTHSHAQRRSGTRAFVGNCVH